MMRIRIGHLEQEWILAVLSLRIAFEEVHRSIASNRMWDRALRVPGSCDTTHSGYLRPQGP